MCLTLNSQEMWYVLKQAEKKLLYVATNMECSDTRLIRISLMLSKRYPLRGLNPS